MPIPSYFYQQHQSQEYEPRTRTLTRKKYLEVLAKARKLTEEQLDDCARAMGYKNNAELQSAIERHRDRSLTGLVITT